MEPRDPSAQLQGDTVPVWLSRARPGSEPLREEELHFKDTTLSHQPPKILRIIIQSPFSEPEGHGLGRHVRLSRLQPEPASTTAAKSLTRSVDARLAAHYLLTSMGSPSHRQSSYQRQRIQIARALRHEEFLHSWGT